MQAKRKMQPLVPSEKKNVPEAPEVRHDRHRKHDHSLDRHRNIIDVAQKREAGGHHQEKNGRDANARQIRAKKTMLVHDASLQVVQKRGNQRRKEKDRRRRYRKQRPVKPWNLAQRNFAPRKAARLFQPPQHFRPKIAAQFCAIVQLANWRKGVPQLATKFTELSFFVRAFCRIFSWAFRQVFSSPFRHAVFFFLYAHVLISTFRHGCTPDFCNFLRSKRTARNMRTLAAAAGIPSASAISEYVSSSTNPSCATRRNFGGNSPNALRSAIRVSCCTAQSGLCSP